MSDFEDGDVFDGLGKIPSDAFIRSIRRRVLVQGVQNDDQLVAQITASCLGGPALDWYEEQTDEMQESWKLLRRAILLRWPTKADSVTQPTPFHSVAASSTIPTPAAAPAPAVTQPLYQGHPVVTPASSGFQDSKRGRIIVMSEDDKRLGYVSVTMNEDGHHYAINSRADAIIVEAARSGRLHNLRIVGSSPDTEAKMLGMSWGWSTANKTPLSEVLANDKKLWGGLSTISGEPSSPSEKTSSTHFPGQFGSAMWSVIADGSILASWQYKTGHQANLIIMMGTTGGTLNFTNRYSKSDPPAWKMVFFIFEPL